MILYKFRQDLENLINNSGLTIDAAYFVLKDVMGEIDELYREQIKREAAIAASQFEEAVAAQEENKTNE